MTCTIVGGEVLKKEIIDVFRRYKSSVKKLLGCKIHLYLFEGKIDFEISSTSKSIIDMKKVRETRIRDINALINFGVDTKLLDAIIIIKAVETWFSILTEQEKLIIFYLHIDLENGKGLSSREIEEKTGISKSKVFRIEDKIIDKINKLV